MQRLTKYSLLLAAIRKHITDENDAELLDGMVSIESLHGKYLCKHDLLSFQGFAAL